MVTATGSEISCGVSQLYGFSHTTIPQIINEAKRAMDDCAFYIFSNLESSQKTKSLVKYIREHKLGTVTATSSGTNPNTDNKIKVWVWKINKNNLQRWSPNG